MADETTIDESEGPGEGESRRGTLAKIGAVAAGAWIAPQILSAPAASAQSAPGPCNCSAVYANGYSPGSTFVLPGSQIGWFGSPPLLSGITFNGVDTFTLPAAGVYSVTYGARADFDSGRRFVLQQNGLDVVGAAISTVAGTWVTQTVLVQALVGDVLQVFNSSGFFVILAGVDPGDPAATIVIHQIA